MSRRINTMNCRSIFITATDTGVGKTIATLALALHFRSKGLKVGVLKPVQCSGDDAAFLKEQLQLDDPLDLINPFFAKEPLSPNIAFKRGGIKFSLSKVRKALNILYEKYDIVLIEGAGGLMVPIKDNYLMADLAKEISDEIVIVSRLNLGTINHTLLTLKAAYDYGLKVKGVIFNETHKTKHGVPEKTNPDVIKKLGKVNIIGAIPFIKIKKLGSILPNLFDINGL